MRTIVSYRRIKNSGRANQVRGFPITEHSWVFTISCFKISSASQHICYFIYFSSKYHFSSWLSLIVSDANSLNLNFPSRLKLPFCFILSITPLLNNLLITEANSMSITFIEEIRLKCQFSLLYSLDFFFTLSSICGSCICIQPATLLNWYFIF